MDQDLIDFQYRIARHCRGARRSAFVARDLKPGTLPDDLHEALMQAYGARAGEPTAPVLEALLAQGTAVANRMAADLDEHLRAGCGHDLNAVILAHPLDGDTHEAPCPTCGLPFTWTAPTVEGIRAELAREAAAGAGAG